ncbi:MAG: hypothetical protein U0183_22100 [Polyangiaceae bacterium]
MSQRYATLSSYEDVGNVALRGSEILAFRTQFDRASRTLSFSAREPGGMLCDLDSTAHNITRRQVDGRLAGCIPKEGDLDAVLGALTGVTWGVAHIVPRLLLGPALVGNCVADARAPKLIASGWFDEEECNLIDLGPDWRGSIVAIGAQSSLLRRKVVAVARGIGRQHQKSVIEANDLWLNSVGMVIRYSPSVELS